MFIDLQSRGNVASGRLQQLELRCLRPLQDRQSVCGQDLVGKHANNAERYLLPIYSSLFIPIKVSDPSVLLGYRCFSSR